MKEVILAVIEELKTHLPEGCVNRRKSDIYPARSIGSMPPGLEHPAIGVKDGAQTFEQYGCPGDGFLMDEVFTIDIVLWASSKSYEGQILGDSKDFGIHVMQDMVIEVLQGTTLGGLIDGCWVMSASASEETADPEKKFTPQRKIITFQCERRKKYNALHSKR